MAAQHRPLVMKFRGTSVADAWAIRRLTEIVGAATRPVVVVVSAMAGVTDGLFAALSIGGVGELRGDAEADLGVERDMAIVCAVGDSLRRDQTLCPRIVSRLEGLPIRMVSQAASRRNLTVVVRDSDVSAAMLRLHEAFFMPEPVES